MNSHPPITEWSPLARTYDPIKIGSIDGTDQVAHDRALKRALLSNYTPNHKVVGDPECTVFVARLNPKTGEKTIKNLFNEFGPIRRHRLVRDIVTGMSKRYAFVEYEDKRSAQKAVREMNRTFLDDRQILVDFECERILEGWKPRRLGGGFGGRKESGQLRFGCKDKPWKKPIGLLKAEALQRQRLKTDGRSTRREDYRHKSFQDSRIRYKT